jgi:hypothetical protein
LSPDVARQKTILKQQRALKAIESIKFLYSSLLIKYSKKCAINAGDMILFQKIQNNISKEY